MAKKSEKSKNYKKETEEKEKKSKKSKPKPDISKPRIPQIEAGVVDDNLNLAY